MQIIKRLDVLMSYGVRSYIVGDVYDDREVIEIKQAVFENGIDSVHSEYHVLDENDKLISVVENCPVVAEYQVIVKDGDDA